MKKIPFATTLIIILSLVLFGVFMISYRTYTNNLNNQFESQASSKLARINGTTRSTIDLRLSNLIRKQETFCSNLKARDIDISSEALDEELANNVSPLSKTPFITSAKELSAFNEVDSMNTTYYNLLCEGTSVLCNSGNMVYLMTPYLVVSDGCYVVYQSFTISEFSALMSIKQMDYAGNSYLMNVNGTIIASHQTSFVSNFIDFIVNASFYGQNSIQMLQKDLESNKAGIIHYSLDGVEIYTYYSPTAVSGFYLLHTVPANLLEQESEAITSIANNFMNTVLIIIFLLIIVVFFVEAFYTMKVNRNRDTLLLEQQRYKIALSHSKDTIWEYNIHTDVMTKTEPNLGIFRGQSKISNFSNLIVESPLIYPEDKEKMIEFQQYILSSDVTFKAEVRARESDSEYYWYELTSTKLFDTDDKPVSIIGQTSNIHNQKMEIEALKQKAGQDTLTKVYNRMTLRERITDLINNLQSVTILGFLIIDIDNFKALNEKLGHLFGDAVLIDVSGKLNKLFRSIDIMGRVGGDEFVVLITDAPSITYIQNMAEHTRTLFHDIYTGEEESFELTCSIGISLYPSDGTDYDTLYEKAELALLNAKLQGRDQLSVYHPSMNSLSANDTLLLQKKKEDEVDYHHEDRSLVDSTIIANAIEILFDSREIDISINMILSLIGVYYNLGRIDIYEYADSTKSVSVTHEWYSDPAYSIASLVKELPSEAISDYGLYIKGENGIMYCNDVRSYFKNSGAELDSIHQGVKSTFQCGISDHGLYVGYISADILEEEHEWSKNEIDSLSLLSKVIGSYLIRLRSMQKADLILQKDLLTNAYNFNTFLSVVSQQRKTHPNQKYAMIYSDIYQFKLLNDNYGYQAGDKVLKHLADIFSSAGGEESILCRVTGDKFTLFLGYNDEEDLTSRANQILLQSKQIITSEGDCYKLNVMIGIYIMSDVDSPIVAVDRANIARKNAQLQKKANYVFFNEAMRLALIEQKQMEDVMEEALANDEFLVYYQPKIDIRTGHICGAEALVRWIRPQVGIVSPASFIPLFEANEFIVNIDFYVLEQVCKYLRSKIDAGYDVFPISVNFSRAHFKSDLLPEHLLETVNRYDLQPYLIEVEITESAFVNSDSYWLHILQRIRSYGFGLAMDDFGSGLSSLNLLCDLPFKVLKIDKDFFHSKTAHQRERIVISNIVRMARELDMDVICEGVETKEQSDFLKSIGCYMAQGYFFDKPLPREVFDQKYFE